MTTLRVLVVATPSPNEDVPWALYDDQQRLVRSGKGAPVTWPAARQLEAVLAASAVRVAIITLPPMPSDRVAAAAAYALEDQLAGPAQTQHLVSSPRGRDGAVEVAIAARAPFQKFRETFARVVAEPAVAPVPPAGTWRWYGSGLSGSFVRKPDGSAFAVSAARRGEPAPAELALALARAESPRVEVAFPVEDAQLRGWSDQCDAVFARTGPWHWDQDGAALAAATDLLQHEFSRVPRAKPASAARQLRWAAAIAAAALILHVGATLLQWSWLRYESWQMARATVSTARNAGAGEAPDAEAAAAALGKRFADFRHAAGLAAPGDALQLLARAAPALGSLPAGTLKSATYSTRAWTLELAKLDAAQVAALDRDLVLAGLATLTATTATGTRMRISPAPGTELP